MASEDMDLDQAPEPVAQDQTQLINKINLYQSKHGRPPFLSKTGFCNALTALYFILGEQELVKLTAPIIACPDVSIMLLGKEIDKLYECT